MELTWAAVSVSRGDLGDVRGSGAWHRGPITHNAGLQSGMMEDWTIKDIKLELKCNSCWAFLLMNLDYLWHMIGPGVGRKIIRHQFDFLFAGKSLTRFGLGTSRFIKIPTNDRADVGIAANRKAKHNFDNASGTSELVLESFKVGGWAHVFNWLEEV